MATKWKSELWSIVAIVAAVLSVMYCFSFIWEIVFGSHITDLFASRRSKAGGGA